MQKQVDLFGFDTVGLSFNEQQEVRAVTRKPSVTVVIDRKALWSSNTYGFGGIRELGDDEDVASATATSDTKADNMTIERLEKKLGLAPVIKDGQWVRDELGFTYRRVGSKFIGERKLGEQGSMLRSLNKQMVLTSARSALEPLFNDPCCWVILASMGVLAARLNMMSPEEDPYACLTAFLEVMAQHDFIDNQRSGDTIRSLTRRENERQRRISNKEAKRAKEEAKTKAKNEAIERLMDDYENDGLDGDFGSDYDY